MPERSGLQPKQATRDGPGLPVGRRMLTEAEMTLQEDAMVAVAKGGARRGWQR